MNVVHPVVSVARTWIGTRFHHQGRLKKTAQHAGGVDCLGLLIGAARELDLRDRDGKPIYEYDTNDYSLSPDGVYLKTMLSHVLSTVASGDIQSGDVALFMLDHNPQHLAILHRSNTEISMIHAFAQSRKVVENALDDFWRQALVGVYRLSSEVPAHTNARHEAAVTI